MGPWGHQWGYGAAMGPSVGPWGHQWGYGAAMGPLWCHVCPPQVSRQLLSLWAAAGRGDAVAVGQAVAALCRRAPTLQAAVAASRRGGGGDGDPPRDVEDPPSGVGDPPGSNGDPPGGNGDPPGGDDGDGAAVEPMEVRGGGRWGRCVCHVVITG